MEQKLKNLIVDYQASVRIAVETMQRTGISLPLTCHHWVKTDIPANGELDGGISYFKHGYGCKVNLQTGSVDFDFGRMGEIDGFDLWRLVNFAGAKLANYGFETNDAVKKSFEVAVKSGKLVPSENLLYYVADSVRLLTAEVCKKFPNDSLPHFDQDDIQILYAHSFLAADLMQRNYRKFLDRLKKNTYLSESDEVDFRIYFSSWLGYLRTTCEGLKQLKMWVLLTKNRPESFRELIPKWTEIDRQLNRYEDSLREFRNNVFHRRKDVKPILRFAADDDGRLAWAEELHSAMAEFFSTYRILCEVHYVTNDRKDESQMGRRNFRNGKAPV